MRNIVVYTNKKESSLADVLTQIDDANVRIEDADKLRDYEMLNPAIIVVLFVPESMLVSLHVIYLFRLIWKEMQ